MKRWTGRLIGLGTVTAAVVAACSYNPPTPGRPFDAPPGDSTPPPDVAPCAGASVECIDSNTLRTCASDLTEVFTPCVWGCLGSTAHCGELQPAGNGIPASDVTSTGLSGEVVLSGTVDGNNGSISGIRAAGTGIISNIEYQQRGAVAMFRFASLRITGTLALGGSRPIVLVADQGIVVEATIDATTQCNGITGGPGGSVGGTEGNDGSGSGSGRGASTTGGGGGGGNGGSGGSGSGTTGGVGGSTSGSATIVTLIGGAGGGGGQGGNAGSGGGGGGAVQLVSNAMIMISSNGGINAGGCGGRPGVSGNGDAGGGGGGAGGVILLEAPTISITGTLAVNGGGGAGGRVSQGGDGTAGGKGTLNRTLSTRGNGDMQGGSGAAGATLLGLIGGENNNVGGGGGGGIGRIRLNTRGGSASVVGSVLSPNFEDSGTTCTQGQAAVQ